MLTTGVVLRKRSFARFDGLDMNGGLSQPPKHPSKTFGGGPGGEDSPVDGSGPTHQPPTAVECLSAGSVTDTDRQPAEANPCGGHRSLLAPRGLAYT